MADATSAASEPEKNGSKLLVVILAAVIAAIAAGGGVYFFAGGKSDALPLPNRSPLRRSSRTAKSPAVYVKFDPPFVVNFEAKGMMRFLQVSIEIMTRDPAMQ